MPKMSGIELAAAVRQRRPGIKVLYMSGYTDSRVRGYRLLVASTTVLQKPFNSASLAQRVREALGDAHSKRLGREVGQAFSACPARGAPQSHLAPAFHSFGDGHFVGELQVAAHRNAHGNACHPDA